MNTVISEPGGGSNPYLNRIKLVHGDITAQDVDAIATIIPYKLEYRGAITQSIIKAAGPELDEHILENIYKPKPGDIYDVPGFNLPCRHVLIGIIPSWEDDFERENRHLTRLIKDFIEYAQNMKIESLALPPLASGRYGFPKKRAARLIVQGMESSLDASLKEVRIVCPEEKTLEFFRQRLPV